MRVVPTPASTPRFKLSDAITKQLEVNKKYVLPHWLAFSTALLLLVTLLLGTLVACTPSQQNTPISNTPAARATKTPKPNPYPSGTVAEFPLLKGDIDPFAITSGLDGNLWFTGCRTDSHGTCVSSLVGRMTLQGHVTAFPIPSAYSDPGIITSGPDGNLWFTEHYNSKIGRVTPTGQFSEFQIPSYSYTRGIAVGADGNLWFTEASQNRIGRITPSGQITEFSPISSGGGPITAGPDGNLWFTEEGGNQIGRITPAGKIAEFLIPTADAAPEGIIKGPDGNLWFVELLGNNIGRINPTGQITEFPIPSQTTVGPYDITAGPDGNLWFTHGGKIGRVTPQGRVTEFALPGAKSGASFITLGSDNNLWFVDVGTNKIGRFTP